MKQETHRWSLLNMHIILLVLNNTFYSSFDSPFQSHIPLENSIHRLETPKATLVSSTVLSINEPPSDLVVIDLVVEQFYEA